MFWERADLFLLIMCLICSFFGIYMVRIATIAMEASGWVDSSVKCVIVQVFSLFLGLGAFVILTFIDADLLAEQWKLLCGINIALLVALVFFGSDSGTGNNSWIRFAGIGIQPSEIVKVIYIIISVGHFVILFGLVVVVSSDLGSASILLLIFLSMFFALGVRLYWFALGGAAVAAAIPLLWTHFLKDYQKKRLIAPYDPTIDPDGWGITWQTTQSKLTLASGRLTGVDAEHRATVFTGKHTDFIFSCVGEELGMIGCIVVMILLLIVMVHIIRMGLKAGRTFDMLLCIGVGSAVAFQTFINIGMCLGVTPVIGITLPFFSYGGSSMVAMFAAMGLVSGVKFKLKPQLFSIY